MIFRYHLSEQTRSSDKLTGQSKKAKQSDAALEDLSGSWNEFFQSQLEERH